MLFGLLYSYVWTAEVAKISKERKIYDSVVALLETAIPRRVKDSGQQEICSCVRLIVKT